MIVGNGSAQAESYGKPDHQASETVISESDEVMAGDGVMMGTDAHR